MPTMKELREVIDALTANTKRTNKGLEAIEKARAIRPTLYTDDERASMLDLAQRVARSQGLPEPQTFPEALHAYGYSLERNHEA